MEKSKFYHREEARPYILTVTAVFAFLMSLVVFIQ
jgi:hypothetical protein